MLSLQRDELALLKHHWAQCSGKLPCENCARRGKDCSPPARGCTIIRVNPTRTHGPQPGATETLKRGPPLARPLALDKQSLYVVEFFDKFLERNNFTGKPRSSSISSIHAILGTQESIFNVVSAIGALQVSRSQPAESRICTRDALDNYHSAVTALRSEITCAGRRGMVGLSWCTLFLGCFEVSTRPMIASNPHFSVLN